MPDSYFADTVKYKANNSTYTIVSISANFPMDHSISALGTSAVLLLLGEVKHVF